MDLNISERLVLLSLLPKEGDFLTLRIVRDLQTELSFTEAEAASLELRQEGDQVMWSTNKDLGKTVKIGERARQLIVDQLKTLDSKKKLEPTHLPIYERFIMADD